MKKLFILTLGISLLLTAKADQTPNWQNLDLEQDGVFGISTEKAYGELLQNKKAQAVIVAVIDGGVDTTHEDLKSILWINAKEKPCNGKDDDHNGFVDDIYGWNFIGGKKGDEQYDNLEMTRIIRHNMDFYDSLSMIGVPTEYRQGYQAYVAMRKSFDRAVVESRSIFDQINDFKNTLDNILLKIGNNHPELDDFIHYKANGIEEKRVCNLIISQLQRQPNFKKFYQEEILDAYIHYKKDLDYHLNLDYDARTLVGDPDNNLSKKVYGNPDVYGPEAKHGTHVAGIIGALRNNAIGIQGVADHVRILVIRAVPDGDERDKDVANAIRYAVDNGARVINMSFGKPYSSDKKVVDEAVKYAMAKDVLLVHAAGNDGLNLEIRDNAFFPTRRYADSSGEANAWIEVGASDQHNDSTLVASFSNYGKTTVDVFAPGVQIYSTIPGSAYESLDGTSMAAPMVSGLAALIREYYPQLTAIQVKDIILRSVVKVNRKVLVRGQKKELVSIPFSDICVSGGVINVYQALNLANQYLNK